MIDKQILIDNISCVDVFEKYVGNLNRISRSTSVKGGRNPTAMAVNTKGWKDFKTGAGGNNCISLFQYIFDCDFKTAINAISSDFGIGDVYYSKQQISAMKRKREREKRAMEEYNRWREKVISYIADIGFIWKSLMEFPNSFPFELKTLNKYIDKISKVENDFRKMELGKIKFDYDLINKSIADIQKELCENGFNYEYFRSIFITKFVEIL